MKSAAAAASFIGPGVLHHHCDSVVLHATIIGDVPSTSIVKCCSVLSSGSLRQSLCMCSTCSPHLLSTNRLCHEGYFWLKEYPCIPITDDHLQQ